MTKYESETQFINRPVEEVYNRFSNLHHLQTFRERLAEPAMLEKLQEQIGQDKIQQIQEQLNNVVFTADNIELETPIGTINLSIIEREAPKLLKFALNGAPMEAYMWIQFLAIDERTSRFRVTLGAELNFFIKKMVGSKLEQAAQGIAQMLAMIANSD